VDHQVRSLQGPVERLAVGDVGERERRPALTHAIGEPGIEIESDDLGPLGDERARHRPADEATGSGDGRPDALEALLGHADADPRATDALLYSPRLGD
jgi:hypothetical protein